MIVRVSLMVAVSIAAFALSHIIDSSTKRNNTIKPSDNDDSSSQECPEEDDQDFSESKSSLQVLEKKKDEMGLEAKTEMKPNLHETELLQDRNVTETELLQKQVKKLEQRKVTLEKKLLEMHALKQQKSYIAHLQMHLQARTEEINMLKVTLNLLQVERHELHEEIRQNLLAKKQIGIANKRILEMQAMICSDSNQMKWQLMMLEKQVLDFSAEGTRIRDAMVEKKHKAVKEIAFEVAELKKKNKELQLGTEELTNKLVAADARICELSNMTESNLFGKLEEEIEGLSLANENLTKQVDKLQRNRFGMVEDLVYQRWLNACLKFEIQIDQTPSTTTRKSNIGTIKSSKLEPQGKINKLRLLNPTSDTNSSHTSPSESDNETDSTTFYSSSSSDRIIRKRSNLIHRIKRWGGSNSGSSDISSPGKSSKGNSLAQTGRIRRFSTSMIPSSVLLKKKDMQDDSSQSPETPILPRVRRVSFNDTVSTLTFQKHIQKSIEEVESIDKSTSTSTSGERLTHCSAMHARNNNAGEWEKEVVHSNDSNMELSNSNELQAQVDIESKVAQMEDLDSRMSIARPADKDVGTEMVHLMVIVFLFFSIMSLVYFFSKIARIY